MSDQATDTRQNEIDGLNRKVSDMKSQVDGLNRRNSELEQRLSTVAEPDKLLKDLQAKANAAGLEVHKVRRCHAAGIDESLLDGYQLDSAEAIDAKVVQLATKIATSATERINEVLASGRKPGSGNMESGSAPDLSGMTSAQLKAYHIKEAQREFDARRPPTPAY